MRRATLFIVTAVIVLCLGQPAFPGKLTVTQAGKVHEGWSSDLGKIVVTNPRGKTIMYGELTPMGHVELTSSLTDETYVGQVNPMGRGLLMSPKTGDTLRIDVER